VFQNFLQERYYVFQELKNKTKTFWSVPKFFWGKTELFECFKKFKNKTNHLLVKKNTLDLKENFLV
jgi:hypothetical protein